MGDVKEIFKEYTRRAEQLLAEDHPDHNACLVALENDMADNSDLGEGDRLELRAYMEEFRRQKINGYEAGALNPKISNPESGPRSGEYDSGNINKPIPDADNH